MIKFLLKFFKLQLSKRDNRFCSAVPVRIKCAVSYLFIGSDSYIISGIGGSALDCIACGVRIGNCNCCSI